MPLNNVKQLNDSWPEPIYWDINYVSKCLPAHCERSWAKCNLHLDSDDLRILGAIWYIQAVYLLLFSLFMYSTFFFYVFDFIANLLFPFVFEFLFSTQIRHYSLSNEATCSSFGGRRGDRPALWQSASYPDARKYLNDHLKMPLTSPSFC